MNTTEIIPMLADGLGEHKKSQIPPVVAVPVTRTKEGYWLHPAIEEMLAGREGVETAEFNAWLEDNGLETSGSIWGDEDSDEYRVYLTSGSCAAWEPEPPEGEGWFLASIFDSEDWGPECFWLRNKSSQPTPEERIAELEALLMIDVPQTVWPEEVKLVWSQVKRGEALSEIHQRRMKYHINRMLLDGMAVPDVIDAANQLLPALEVRS